LDFSWYFPRLEIPAGQRDTTLRCSPGSTRRFDVIAVGCEQLGVAFDCAANAVSVGEVSFFAVPEPLARPATAYLIFS
jgi:hypothetical protein